MEPDVLEPLLKEAIRPMLERAGGNYAGCTDADIDKFFGAALRHGKMLIFLSQEFDLTGVMTWAMLTPDRRDEYLLGSKIGGEDFVNDEGELWVMDFLAPYGNVCRYMKTAQRFFALKYGEGTICNWMRPYRKPTKLGYAVMRGGNG